MLIRSVTAHAFGPLSGETLELADGLTVVHGPNESAKSSWHAAIFAALCGRRRGSGRATPEEQDFRARHRPWDDARWLVSARVVLDDGRTVELRQDLDGKVDCDAVDLELGRDVSAEIINAGTPDAARWLGLDRASFRATAMVAQAQLLDVLNRADGLQTHLQRAASTAAGDQTAAAARQRIDRFQADEVGSERAPTKPLRRAIESVESARRALATAEADHQTYERRLVELESRRTASAQADQALRRAEAAQAVRSADEANDLAAAASALAATLGEQPAPAPTAEVLALVAGALATPGPAQAEPADPGTPAPPEPEEELYALARALEAPLPVVDEQLAEQVTQARAELARAETGLSRSGRWLGAGAVASLAGVAIVVAGWPTIAVDAVGAVLTVAAVAAAIVNGSRRRRGAALVVAARARLAEAEHRLTSAGSAVAAAAAQRDAAVHRATAAGWPAEASALRALAQHRTEERAFRQRDQHWQREAEQRLIGAAQVVGLAVATPAEATAALRAWQHSETQAAQARERWHTDATRLAGMLRGATLDDVQRLAAEATERARLACARAGLDESTVDDYGLADLTELRSAARSAAEQAHASEVSLGDWSARATPVGEAEETLARAEAELASLRQLDETLGLTRRFLLEAEQTAHRTIAPRLAQAVRGWLPTTTGGRYTEVTVDPEDLQVQVRGPAGRWRPASHLSHGTAEQIYLLLRMALAEQLVAPGTRCPLLLDEVTVHADPVRTHALLELLLAAAADRQIVLFTQQDMVAEWARARLAPPHDALVELPAVALV